MVAWCHSPWGSKRSPGAAQTVAEEPFPRRHVSLNRLPLLCRARLRPPGARQKCVRRRPFATQLALFVTGCVSTLLMYAAPLPAAARPVHVPTACCHPALTSSPIIAWNRLPPHAYQRQRNNDQELRLRGVGGHCPPPRSRLDAPPQPIARMCIESAADQCLYLTLLMLCCMPNTAPVGVSCRGDSQLFAPSVCHAVYQDMAYIRPLWSFSDLCRHRA